VGLAWGLLDLGKLMEFKNAGPYDMGYLRGSMSPSLQAATSKTVIGPYQGWPPTGHRAVGHGGLYRYFRESMFIP
jgi:hypothetical protein